MPSSLIELEPERWVERHGDVLYRYALLRLGDPDQAENVVQETLLAALESKQSFSGRSAERTWLVGILKFKIIDAYRKGARESKRKDDLPDISSDDFDASGKWRSPPQQWRDTPNGALETQQLYRALEGCLDKLNNRLARAFSLRLLDGLETGEICKILEVTPTNLGVMLYRARHGLRRCLEQNWFDDRKAQDGDA